MLMRRAKTGSFAARLLSSAALLLVSGAYAAWQETRETPPPLGNSLVRVRVGAAAPRPAQPAPASTANAASTAAEPSATATPSARTDTKVRNGSAQTVSPSFAFNETPPPRGAAANVPAAVAPDDAASAQTPSIVPPVQSTIAPPAAEPSRPHNKYADGDFKGQPADCNWGIVQVEVEIRNGAIAAVDFLQMPNHRRRSAEISSWSAPSLAHEAIQEQTADVDIVTSATNTSSAFQQSLKSALEMAAR
jgi:uncharacterized protein with FMN-binding domain